MDDCKTLEKRITELEADNARMQKALKDVRAEYRKTRVQYRIVQDARRIENAGADAGANEAIQIIGNLHQTIEDMIVLYEEKFEAQIRAVVEENNRLCDLLSNFISEDMIRETIYTDEDIQNERLLPENKEQDVAEYVASQNREHFGTEDVVYTSASIVAFTPSGRLQVWKVPGAPFGGTYADFLSEIKQITTGVFSIIRRAPMKEYLRGTRIPGVPDDYLIAAISELALYRYHPAQQNEFQERRLELYNELIDPHRDDDEVSRDEALRRFREMIDATFDSMEKAGRGDPTAKDNLKSMPGRPRKNGG